MHALSILILSRIAFTLCTYTRMQTMQHTPSSFIQVRFILFAKRFYFWRRKEPEENKKYKVELTETSKRAKKMEAYERIW